MTTDLTRLRVTERREALWQIAVLHVHRVLVRSGLDHLDAAAMWSSVAAEASRRAHQHATLAIAEGDSYAEVARALGISRQAAAKRYGTASTALMNAMGQHVLDLPTGGCTPLAHLRAILPLNSKASPSSTAMLPTKSPTSSDAGSDRRS